MFVVVECANLTVRQQDEAIVLVFLVSLVFIFDELKEQNVLIFEFFSACFPVEEDVSMLNE